MRGKVQAIWFSGFLRQSDSTRRVKTHREGRGDRDSLLILPLDFSWVRALFSSDGPLLLV